MTPFAKDFPDSIASLTEKELIRRIVNIFGDTVLPSPYGPGDDCALIKLTDFKSANALITSDAVILNRHFSDYENPFLAGEKLLKRNISDIASMGGKPLFAQSSSIASKNLSILWLDEFCKGLAHAAKEYEIKFSGGDLSAYDSDFFSMHLTMLGEAPLKPMLRNLGKVGDKIFVTGKLGASFESGKHLTFKPRLDEGIFFSEQKGVTSCTDISDGLAEDLPDILEVGMYALLKNVPQNILDGKEVGLEKALCDGEDYELLFSFSGDSEELKSNFHSKFGYDLYEIGSIKKAPNKDLSGAIFIEENSRKVRFSKGGFSHYLS